MGHRLIEHVVILFLYKGPIPACLTKFQTSSSFFFFSSVYLKGHNFTTLKQHADRRPASAHQVLACARQRARPRVDTEDLGFYFWGGDTGQA